MIRRLLTAIGVLAASAKSAQPRVLSGDASFYAKSYVGKTMANGHPYNARAFTIACDDIPLGKTVYVTYKTPAGNTRSCHATVTDRGPAEWLRKQGRIFDLSWAVFNHLESPRVGVSSTLPFKSSIDGRCYRVTLALR